MLLLKKHDFKMTVLTFVKSELSNSKLIFCEAVLVVVPLPIRPVLGPSVGDGETLDASTSHSSSVTG